MAENPYPEPKGKVIPESRLRFSIRRLGIGAPAIAVRANGLTTAIGVASGSDVFGSMDVVEEAVLRGVPQEDSKDAARDDPDRLVRIERVGTMTISYTELRKRWSEDPPVPERDRGPRI